jgi:hypothetical protein
MNKHKEREDSYMEYNIGDIVKTKKTHPCGSNQWEITRIGVDFKLKCQGCRTYCCNGKTKSNKSNNKNNKEKRRSKLTNLLLLLYDFQ